MGAGRHARARRNGRVGALVGALGTTLAVAVSAVAFAPGPAGSGTAPERLGSYLFEHLHSQLAAYGTSQAALDTAVAQRPLDPADHVRERTQRPPAVPGRSGSGKRVVLDISGQRVWLVDRGAARRTYLISGSTHRNLRPGSYEVYSRSRDATSYDLSSTMRYFVRFTSGDRAAIGFHDIPRDNDGEPIQQRDQLGTPLSAGCIRQARPDAQALWRFAGVGTKVVVVA